jgi:hypothetical protein
MALGVLHLSEVDYFEVLKFNLTYTSFENQMINLALTPPFCQTIVVCAVFYFLGGLGGTDACLPV